MHIKRFAVDLEEWGPNKGQYKAEITVVGGQPYSPEVKLPLPPDITGQIIELVGQAAAQTMETAAREFRQEVEAHTLLELQPSQQITDQDDPQIPS